MPRYLVEYTIKQDGVIEVEAANERDARMHVENNTSQIQHELRDGLAWHTLEAEVRDIAEVK